MPFFVYCALGFLALQVAETPKALPPDLRITAHLEDKLSSKNATVGQVVELRVDEDVMDKKRTVYIPKGAKLTGRVTHVVRSTPGALTGEISFHVERAQWKEGEVALDAYAVTIAMPLLLVDENRVPQDEERSPNTLQVAVTQSAANAIAKQARRRAADPTFGRPEEQFSKVRQKSEPVPADWGIIQVDDPNVWSIIGSNERDISLPKGMRFVLRNLGRK